MINSQSLRPLCCRLLMHQAKDIAVFLQIILITLEIVKFSCMQYKEGLIMFFFVWKFSYLWWKSWIWALVLQLSAFNDGSPRVASCCNLFIWTYWQCLSRMESYDRCLRINSMLCHVYDICSFVVKSASTYWFELKVFICKWFVLVVCCSFLSTHMEKYIFWKFY